METQRRTLAKTISWRIFATLITSLVVWQVTGKPEMGLSVATLDCLIKLVTYYIHERIWNAVPFGCRYRESPQSLNLDLARDTSSSVATH